DAEHAPGSAALTLRDWTDGKDPYTVTAPLLDFHTSPIQDSASPWVVNSSGATAGSTSVPSDFSKRHVHAMSASWVTLLPAA
ncbi:hypothetical protein ACWC9H_36620, partial [Streptomyces sp. NPDC001251]